MVDYAPNLSDGSQADEQTRPRYVGAQIQGGLSLNRTVRVHGSVGQRRLASKRDENTLNKLSAGLDIHFNGAADERALVYRVEAIYDFATQLTKNSYTHFADQTIKAVKIDEPWDFQLMQSLSYSRALSDRNTILWTAGAGFIKTFQGAISGNSQSDEGCLYDFDISHGQGVITQTEPCANVLAFERTYPSYETIESVLGFHPQDDLTFSAWYSTLGIGYRYTRHRLTTSFGYQFEHINRDAFDDRLIDAGKVPIDSNQVASVIFDFQYSAESTLSLTAQYQSHPMLSTLPLLYTGITSERFSQDALLLNLSFRHTF